MKLIIAGGRNYKFSDSDIYLLNALHLAEGITEVVSGNCSGADICGEEWAAEWAIPIKRFPVTKKDWDLQGRAAGPIRNRKMAEYADAVVLFPGGKGTESMRKEAVKAGLRIFDWRAAPWRQNSA